MNSEIENTNQNQIVDVQNDSINNHSIDGNESAIKSDGNNLNAEGVKMTPEGEKIINQVDPEAKLQTGNKNTNEEGIQITPEGEKVINQVDPEVNNQNKTTTSIQHMLPETSMVQSNMSLYLGMGLLLGIIAIIAFSVIRNKRRF